MKNSPEMKQISSMYPTKTVSKVDEEQHPIFKAEKKILTL